jgi:hypothetical protein
MNLVRRFKQLVDKMPWFLLILLMMAIGIGAWWSLGHPPP